MHVQCSFRKGMHITISFYHIYVSNPAYYLHFIELRIPCGQINGAQKTHHPMNGLAP